jgi:uncharacterized membrane protein
MGWRAKGRDDGAKQAPKFLKAKSVSIVVLLLLFLLFITFLFVYIPSSYHVVLS